MFIKINISTLTNKIFSLKGTHSIEMHILYRNTAKTFQGTLLTSLANFLDVTCAQRNLVKQLFQQGNLTSVQFEHV